MLRRFSVFLWCAAVVFGQGPVAPQTDSANQQKCSVSGTVLNAASGEPLRKARVELVRDGEQRNGSPGYVLDSAADGTFRFDGIDAGNYRLSGSHIGFLRTSLGSKQSVGAGTQITLKAGQVMSGLKLSLTPQAVIAGRVVDQDGDPVDDVSLQLLHRGWVNGKRQLRPSGFAEVDDSGGFRINGVSPGKYFLVAAPQSMGNGRPQLVAPPGKPDIRIVRTYYPSADSIESASVLEVAAGQEMNGVEIRVRREAVHHIRGRLVLGDQKADMIPLQISRKGEFMFGPQLMVQKDGSFDVAGLAPGEYVIQSFPMRSSNVVVKQSVELGSSDIKDLMLTPVPVGSLSGQVRILGAAAGTDLSGLRVGFRSAEDAIVFMGAHATVAADGALKVEDVQAGRYFLNVGSLPDGVFLGSVQFRGQDVTGKGIDVSQSVAGDLEITLQTGAAKVSGTVQQADDAQAGSETPTIRPSETVFLIPETLNEDGSGDYSSDCDQTGSFTFKNVRPGRYRAVAVVQLSYDSRESPALLRALAEKGTDLQVNQGETKQVQLTLLTDSDLQQAEAKADAEQ